MDTVDRKTRAILVKAFGRRATRLFEGSSTQRMMQTIAGAFAHRMNREKAADVGFHLGDWAHDAALVLALHMYPERFTTEEIRQVADFVTAGTPYHCAALATHFGYEGLARDGIREAKQQERSTSGSRQRRVRTAVSSRNSLARRA